MKNYQQKNKEYELYDDLVWNDLGRIPEHEAWKMLKVIFPLIITTQVKGEEVLNEYHFVINKYNKERYIKIMANSSKEALQKLTDFMSHHAYNQNIKGTNIDELFS